MTEDFSFFQKWKVMLVKAKVCEVLHPYGLSLLLLCENENENENN